MSSAKTADTEFKIPTAAMVLSLNSPTFEKMKLFLAEKMRQKEQMVLFVGVLGHAK